MMTEKGPGGHGLIVKQATVFCGLCHYWEYLESSRQPAKEAREQGWRRTAKYGWVCPDHDDHHS